MKVCILGLWHLGSVTAACLASLGHDVTGLDSDQSVVDNLSIGKAPLYEPGLDDLILEGLSSRRLCFSTSPDLATKNIEVLWVTYDTPVDDDDQADVYYVISRIESILPYLPVSSTVLVSSQIPVGSLRRMEAIAVSRFPNHDITFSYSPENLRLGKSLDIFLNPDRIVVGTRFERDRLRLGELLSPITNRIEWMSIESAEMTKHAINAFLATSVTFANEIATICERVGADAKEVERGLKTEQRIGPKAYLSPGGAFAGGTLARDINFLASVATENGLKVPILSSVNESNDEHKNWTKQRLLYKFSNLTGKTIAVWGLTYKPGTDTLRRSLAIELCDWLLEQGAKLHVHDPVVKSLPLEWEERVSKYRTPLDALNGAIALVVATEWPQYRDLSVMDVSLSDTGLFVVDPNRFLIQFIDAPGIEYAAVGTTKGLFQ